MKKFTGLHIFMRKKGVRKKVQAIINIEKIEDVHNNDIF